MKKQIFATIFFLFASMLLLSSCEGAANALGAIGDLASSVERLKAAATVKYSKDTIMEAMKKAGSKKARIKRHMGLKIMTQTTYDTYDPNNPPTYDPNNPPTWDPNNPPTYDPAAMDMCTYFTTNNLDMSFDTMSPVDGEVSGTITSSGLSSTSNCANDILTLTLGMTAIMSEYNDGIVPNIGDVTINGDMTMDVSFDMPLSVDFSSNSDSSTANLSGKLSLTGELEGELEFDLTDQSSCSTTFPDSATFDYSTYTVECTGTNTGTANGENVNQEYIVTDVCTESTTDNVSFTVTCESTNSITENGETKTETVTDTFTF